MPVIEIQVVIRDDEFDHDQADREVIQAISKLLTRHKVGARRIERVTAWFAEDDSPHERALWQIEGDYASASRLPFIEIQGSARGGLWQRWTLHAERVV